MRSVSSGLGCTRSPVSVAAPPWLDRGGRLRFRSEFIVEIEGSRGCVAAVCRGACRHAIGPRRGERRLRAACVLGTQPEAVQPLGDAQQRGLDIGVPQPPGMGARLLGTIAPHIRISASSVLPRMHFQLMPRPVIRPVAAPAAPARRFPESCSNLTMKVIPGRNLCKRRLRQDDTSMKSTDFRLRSLPEKRGNTLSDPPSRCANGRTVICVQQKALHLAVGWSVWR